MPGLSLRPAVFRPRSPAGLEVLSSVSWAVELRLAWLLKFSYLLPVLRGGFQIRAPIPPLRSLRMNFRIFSIFIVSCSVLAAQQDPGAASGASLVPAVTEGLDDAAPPSRPATRVLDQTGAFTSGESARISRQFTASAETGLNVYLILLNSRDGLPEQDAAGELARLWEDGPLTAVFLHVPGQPLSLGFAGPRLASLQPGEINAFTESALKAGRARTSLPEQTKTAASQLIQDYARFQAGDPLMSVRGPSEGPAPGLISLISWIIGGGCALMVPLVLFVRYRRSQRPRLFPLTPPRQRFSAPHSGGNNAIISFPNQRQK